MFIFDFLNWHYFQGSEFILKACFNFVLFSFHFFSVSLLLKTLFSPWRRVEVEKKSSGFSVERFFHQLSFNLISRVIGFLVRSFLIGWGLIFSLVFLVLGLALFVIWQALSLFSWPFFLLSRIRAKKKLVQSDKELILRGRLKNFVCQRLGVKEEKLKTAPAEEVQQAIVWFQKIEKEKKRKKRFWSREDLFKIGSLGSDLAFGYTPWLDKYSQDLSLPASFSHQLVGRKKEIAQIESVLTRKSQNNVLLVGEPGVGKRTILLGLAKAINERRIKQNLFFKRVLLLDMNAILAQASSADQGRASFSLLLEEARRAGNVILVVDQLEKYISPQKGVDLTTVVAQAGQKKGLQLIGVTTPAEFEKYIFTNEQIMKYFEKVEVVEPTQAEALEILMKILPSFEKGRQVIVSLPALKEIISQSDNLITHIPFPEKAIDLLDELVNRAESAGRRMVSKKEVHQLVSEKIKVPVGDLSQTEKGKLKNLAILLHQQVVNQKEAVAGLVEAMQRTRVGIADKQKPVGTFLFLGPTGVGKTETAKALAAAYFGSQEEMVRFDLSQPFDLDIFIREIREHPFAVLLLDEFEKADRKTLNLFLTVLDEGYLRDREGKQVSFKNMIIICTSNAAAEFIRQTVRDNPGTPSRQFKDKLVNYVLEKGLFSPELINRFDQVVVFKPLTPDQVEKIAELMMEKLASRLEKKGMQLVIESQVYPALAQRGHSFQFGARPMKRLIADEIETLIAQKILNEE